MADPIGRHRTGDREGVDRSRRTNPATAQTYHAVVSSPRTPRRQRRQLAGPL